MALTLNKNGITTGNTVEAYHVTQSIDAFTGIAAYNISLSGSFNLTGSVTEGNLSRVTGLYSHAEGSGSLSSGVASHAAGFQSTASGDYSFASGYQCKALGQSSLAMGVQAVANGQGGVAFGYGTFAGQSALSLGSATSASGQYSIAAGDTSVAMGIYSFAHGSSTIASGSWQFVVGKSNTQGDNTSLFIVGNGSSVISRKDAFKVRMSGSIVLPTTQSAAPSWTGIDGEIVPATVGGKYFLYMWMSGAWRSGSFV